MFSLKLKKVGSLVLAALTLSILITFTPKDVKAECPSGYQQETINFIYRTYSPYPNGIPVTCPIQLTYCYFCSATGVGFDIQILEFTKNCNYPINPDFWAQARTAMLNDLLNKSTCIAPCSWGGWTNGVMKITHINCWIKTHYAGTPANQLVYTICDGSASCITVFKVCVEYDEDGNATLNEILDHQYAWPGEICNLYGEPDDETEYGFWESGCFMFTIDCPNF